MILIKTQVEPFMTFNLEIHNGSMPLDKLVEAKINIHTVCTISN